MASASPLTTLSIERGIAVVTIDAPPVNALSAAVRAGIRDRLGEALAAPTATAVVLMCAGRTFVAGADITEFGKPPQSPTLLDLEHQVEAAAKPVVAAIHGTALGGGLELALACHYRIAAPSAAVGLPEVKLGLLPGAGGTQRLPRLVGPEKALDIVTSGNPVPAAEAKALGIVDELAGEGRLREDAIAFALSVADRRPLPRVRDLAGKIEPARGQPGIFAEFRKANARRFRGLVAPEYNIRAIEAAVALPFEEGMALERKLFLELLGGAQSAAQRYAFFAERAAAKVPDLAAGTATLPVETVGIVGAGTMGGGIAMNFLNAGLPVTIVEATPAALDRGLSIIRRNYEATAAKGRLTEADVGERMARLTGTLDLARLASADLVIEAVFEDMDLKKQVFARLDAVARPGAILATNTSYLDVDAIAAATQRPEHVLGMHFFSPANVMRLLEIVRAARTAKPVLATAMQIARRIGKVAVVVGVCHGFVGNRMLAQRQREANQLVLEGAMPWDVDRVLYEFGFPMGPFAMSDLAGLDIGWSAAASKSSTLREVLCEMGRRGQKTGAGFYDYDEKRKAAPSPVVEKVILDFAAGRGIERRKIGDAEILDRCLYPMINEGARILEEGKALRASDIDVVWVNGYGWPVYRGGPMYYADTLGLDRVVARLRELAAAHGPGFAPAGLLERLAREGRRFQDV